MAAPQNSRYIRGMPFSPSKVAAPRPGFRTLPAHSGAHAGADLITLLALCAGLTAIRLAFEEKLEWAVAAIVFAAMLDGIDGRVARMLKGTSKFGAELDSLADSSIRRRPGIDALFLGSCTSSVMPAGSRPWCLRSRPGCGLPASTS